MEAVSVAVALPSGEMATGIIAAIDGHPLLDLCGIARSIPDLMRLLERFSPAVLLISPSLLEELGPEPTAEDAARLSAPVSFLISQADARWEEERLSELLRLPLRYGGLIGTHAPSASDMFDDIKRKLDIYRADESRPAFSSRKHEGSVKTSLYSVIGCKGGVGTTLLSCALAAAMSSSGRRVLLMEMQREQSQLLYLKPHGEGMAVLDLMPLAEEISWDLVQVSVHRHAAGFHLLPYGDSGGPAMGAAVPEPLLRNLLFLFDLVIQDFPACSLQAFPPLLHYDPEVLLVTLPDTLAATCARGVAARLRRTGMEHHRLRLVVNRCGAHHTLGPCELARAAAAELLAALPDDARSGLDFAELGELPRAESPLGRAVMETAAALGCGTVPAAKANTLRRLKKMRVRSHKDPLTGDR